MTDTASLATSKEELTKQYNASAKHNITKQVTDTHVITVANQGYVFPDHTSRYIQECIMLFEMPDGQLEINVGKINEIRRNYYLKATLEVVDNPEIEMIDLLQTQNQNRRYKLDPQNKYRLSLELNPRITDYLAYSMVLDFDPK